MKQKCTNDETAAVFTAIKSETSAFRYWHQTARKLGFDVQGLAKEIKREIKRNTPDVQGVYGDLLAEALGRVNWYEVADLFIKSCRGFEDPAWLFGEIKNVEDSDDALDAEIIQ